MLAILCKCVVIVACVALGSGMLLHESDHIDSFSSMESRPREVVLGLDGSRWEPLHPIADWKPIFGKLKSYTQKKKTHLVIFGDSNEEKFFQAINEMNLAGGHSPISVAVGNENSWDNKTWLLGEKTNDMKQVINQAVDATKNSIDAVNNCLAKPTAAGFGPLETFVYDGFPNFTLTYWKFWPEHAEMIWSECLEQGMKALHPDFIVWNVGFHIMHLHPVRGCNANQSAWDEGKTWLNFESTIEATTVRLLKIAPRVFWKTVNWVCDSAFTHGYAEMATNWNNPETRKQMEDKCHKACPQYGSKSCYDNTLLAHGSEIHRNISLKVFEHMSKSVGKPIGIIDAWKNTRDHCEATVQSDGRHFPIREIHNVHDFLIQF